jgi:hypothetical protein
MLLMLLPAALPLPLSAHHSWSGYDMANSVTLRGVVTQYDWSNPHVWINLDVTDEQGTVQKWAAGGPSPSRMANTGWTKDSLKLGDAISVTGHRLENGAFNLRLSSAMLPDGRQLVCYGGR